MNKSMIAILIALLMTACVGASIFTVGGAALLNKNGSPVSNSPAQAVNVSASTQPTDQVAQYQNLVAQYQDREKQYQQREQQLQDQLAQANAQIQEDQQLVDQARSVLSALQQRGVIQITDDGRILITR